MTEPTQAPKTVPTLVQRIVDTVDDATFAACVRRRLQDVPDSVKRYRYVVYGWKGVDRMLYDVTARRDFATPEEAGAFVCQIFADVCGVTSDTADAVCSCVPHNPVSECPCERTIRCLLDDGTPDLPDNIFFSDWAFRFDGVMQFLDRVCEIATPLRTRTTIRARLSKHDTVQHHDCRVSILRIDYADFPVDKTHAPKALDFIPDEHIDQIVDNRRVYWVRTNLTEPADIIADFNLERLARKLANWILDKQYIKLSVLESLHRDEGIQMFADAVVRQGPGEYIVRSIADVQHNYANPNDENQDAVYWYSSHCRFTLW